VVALATAVTQFLTRVGINRPAFYSVLTRGTQGAAALLGIVLVGHVMDRPTQGYYFAILGFVAFVQLADFGLMYAVMQSASHEAGNHAIEQDTSTTRGAQRQLAALLKGASRFNAATTLLSTLVVGAIGTRVLNLGTGGASGVETGWWPPWLAALIATGAGQLLNPRVSLLEGAGFVSAVWFLRFVQESAAAIALCCALAIGWGLWAIPLSYLSRVTVGLLWLQRPSQREYFTALRRDDAYGVGGSYWRTEVWPFQWRVGVSALSGYLIFQFFTPLMFALKGPTIAGQFGMTLTLTNGLLTVTTAWLNSQAPRFGKLIAARAYAELDREFNRSLGSSFLFVIVMGAALTLGLMVLIYTGQPLAARMLGPTSFVFFVAATVANHVIFAMAVYLRAHRREPLLVSSVVGAAATPIVVAYAGLHGDATTIAASYFGLTVLGLGVTTLIFLSRSRAWHGTNEA